MNERLRNTRDLFCLIEDAEGQACDFAVGEYLGATYINLAFPTFQCARTDVGKIGAMDWIDPAQAIAKQVNPS